MRPRGADARRPHRGDGKNGGPLGGVSGRRPVAVESRRGERALALAEAKRQEDGSFEIRMRDYAALEPLLASLRSDGAVIREMEVSPPALEDVFRRVMAR